MIKISSPLDDRSGPRMTINTTSAQHDAVNKRAPFATIRLAFVISVLGNARTMTRVVSTLLDADTPPNTVRSHDAPVGAQCR